MLAELKELVSPRGAKNQMAQCRSCRFLYVVRSLNIEDAERIFMQVMAANGVSERVSVVNKDVALLERGRDVRYLGCNLAIADL